MTLIFLEVDRRRRMMGEALETGEAKMKVAVVVPVYSDVMTADEEISYRHLTHFLGHHDKFVGVPDGCNVNFPGFGVRRFRPEFFANTATYSALLLSEGFYQSFAAYEYILVYQLDALVFSDQLLEWCSKDLDYIGAPWFKGEGVDFVDEAAVGNGGFSLRRVESFLKITRAPGFERELEKYRDALIAAQSAAVRLLDMPRKIARRINSATRHAPKGIPADPGERLNEDCFWSFRAVKYDPDFKIASVAEALRFSFEVDPERCFERSNRQLPFGCHAWNKYNREFWTPYLLK